MASILQKLHSEIFITLADWDLVTSFMANIGLSLSCITLQILIRSSQTSPHFVRWIAEIRFKLNNLKNLALQRVWGLIKCFGTIGSKIVYLT